MSLIVVLSRQKGVKRRSFDMLRMTRGLGDWESRGKIRNKKSECRSESQKQFWGI